MILAMRFRRTRAAQGAVVAMLMGISGCGGDGHPPPPCLVGCDAGPQCPTTYDPPPSSGDVDGDGIPDDEDPDADGDGYDNAYENVGGHWCADHDPDGDGIDNWLDTDSDADGVPDADEMGTSNPYAADTDGDGFTDLIEIGVGTSPTSSESHPSSADIVVELPYGGGDVPVTVRFPNRIENADVFFLVDTTGSMSEERTNLIAGMRDVIVPALAEAFDDVRYGVAGFDDYPVDTYGGMYDAPFYLLSPMIDGLEDRKGGVGGSCPTVVYPLRDGANGTADIVDALQALGCHGGQDGPEAYVPALWTTATGGALTWSTGSVPAQTECPAGTLGYPCFREDALPIIVLVGDASFHNGPGGTEPYEGLDAPTYADAVAALDAIGAKVVSIYSGGDTGVGLTDYLQLARDTMTLKPDSTEMVFEVATNGTGLDTTVVTALSTLAAGTQQDVSTRIDDADEVSFDATSFVTGVSTVEGYTEGGAPGPGPDSYTSKDATTFFGVVPGAEVEYQITLRNDTRMPGERAEVHVLRVSAIGSGGAAFAARKLILVIARDGVIVRP